ncbi:MAG TPA: hypothetical protein VM409_05055 [Chloroflexia bacterium]|nr:hypothetical protein [Chloroflexia bacterium]
MLAGREQTRLRHAPDEDPDRDLPVRQSSAAWPGTTEGMLPSAFLKAVDGEVRSYYKAKGEQINGHLRSRISQFWFGTDRSIHYEVWIHERTLQLEIGLHMESTQERNRAIYDRLGHDLLLIKAALGQSMWLEEWDRGWTRIYQTEPLWPLDNYRVRATRDRIMELVEVLQPMLAGL